MHTAEKPERARAPRLRTITPAPPVEGWAREVASLEEAGTELAVVFWRVLRRVRAWAETPPEGRAGLFEINKKDARERLALAGVHAPDLVEAFGTFALLVRAPGMVGAKQLAEACHQVHEWAEERSLVKVAMLFAEAAAMADPEDPAWANHAGRLCRRAARDDRAATWYHRGFGLGVRTRSYQEIIRAQIGYGNLMKDLGQHEEARRFFERAAQRAINTGRLRQAGEAYHDLLAIAAEVGTYQQGEQHARRALEYYPIHHPRLPILVHDWAFLLVRLRYYTPAIPLLELAVARAFTPEMQTFMWGTLARAAAGARRQDRFYEIERRLWDLIELNNEYAPAALIHLAEGARAFGQWDRARELAAAVVERARSRKNALLERDALLLQEKLAAREVAPVEQDPLDLDRITRLSQRFEARLRKWKAPSRYRPGADTEHTRSDTPAHNS